MLSVLSHLRVKPSAMDTETKSTWWSSPNEEESDVSACPIIGLRRSELRQQIIGSGVRPKPTTALPTRNGFPCTS